MNPTEKDIPTPLPEEDEAFEEKKFSLVSFIDSLPHLSDLEKWHWKKDARVRLDRGDDWEDLKLDYEFYNTTAQIRNEICSRAPVGKGGELCTLIDAELLYKPHSGMNRHEKKAALLDLQKLVEEFLKNKTSLQFLARKHFELGGLRGKVMKVLSEKLQEAFEKYYESVFTPDFWRRQEDMTPTDFPNFTTEFNFSAPEDFLKSSTLEDLKTIPKKLKKSLLRDADELLAEPCFSEKDRTMYRTSLRRFAPENVSGLLKQLLYLRSERDRKLPRYEREQQEIKTKREKEKEKEELQQKTKTGGRNLFDKMKDLHDKKQFESSLKWAQQLERFDPVTSKYWQRMLRSKIERQKQKAAQEKQQERKPELGAEKMKRVEFLDRCIEHARKVDEEAVMPREDPKVWSQEGVRNRRKWLKDTGKWNEYVALNRSDKNIPKNADPTGFRFRWLNVETGTNLTGAKAEQGIKYLQRYKDSGYRIAALAGAFSLNWRGASSPTYSPQRFIEKVQAEKSRILGKSSSSPEKKSA